MRFNIGLTGAILIIFGNICASVILYFPHKPSGLIPIKSVGRLRVGLTSSDNEIMNDSIPCSKDLEKNLQETKKIGQFIWKNVTKILQKIITKFNMKYKNIHRNSRFDRMINLSIE